MHRDSLTFDEFKEHFINKPIGYHIVYSQFAETTLGESVRAIEIDAICEWRLGDGKIKFWKVTFDTEEEFQAIVKYLEDCAKSLNKAILKRISELKLMAFAVNTMPEG